MLSFIDFQAHVIQVTTDAIEHIANDHPEITLTQIQTCLIEPVEVRKSKFNPVGSACETQLYYGFKTDSKNRYVIVVVKFCPDGNFLKTAYTGETMKTGELVFRKDTT